MRNANTHTHSDSYFNPTAYSYTQRQSNTQGSPDSSSSPKPVTAIDSATPKGHCSCLAVSRRSRVVASFWQHGDTGLGERALPRLHTKQDHENLLTRVVK